MKKIYVLYECACDDFLIGIYDTLELAEINKAAQEKTYPGLPFRIDTETLNKDYTNE